jgi:hypothetical protein
LKKLLFRNPFNVIKSPPLSQPCPVGGSIAHAIPWNYLYSPHSKLTSSYGVIAIRGCHNGWGDAPKSVRIACRISHENRILSDRIMGVETPIPQNMIYAAAPDGAPPRRVND